MSGEAREPGGNGPKGEAMRKARAQYERGQAKVVERARGRVLQSGDTKASDGNVANIITAVRILFAPVFLTLLLIDAGDGGALRWVATALFVVGIATDGVDGMLARRRNLVTNVGILLDPIADKVLTGGALVGLSILAELPWWVTALILVRELGITAFRFAVLRDRVIPASRGGKLKTVFQAVAISFALAPFAEVARDLGWAAGVPWIDGVNTALMSIALLLTVATGIDYLVQAWRLGRSR
ncbi:CDP-diacylglycerol--glycerol-3-phosphate 3-phosphatidyltransferase [Herbiconiux sp. L3-i23]|uniref:CDP-diacylglycerol--glycerol-3-phosphate 3-phosphatidyltransferase n=1 Tax=Herbiconiux sp. L3-i23 TaxID=2905871 RepID=UPI00205F9049|nr:CDP-diacylglycerol--glycerol-3-phosphate 3-phosphatidyltransferase [Herbiconiux sp. L3-i23]BDI22212.1 CDP-diacylglycerol--glycerol-3-phosphate 3-phosphatidyltransferase [Herbiconiux sp. L3-i23]